MSMKKVMFILMTVAMIGVVNAGNLLVNGNFEDPAGGVIDPLDAGWLKWWSTWNCNIYAEDPEGDHCGAIWWNDAGFNQVVTVGPGTYELGGKLLATGGLANCTGIIEAKIGGVPVLQLTIVPGETEDVWHTRHGTLNVTTTTEIEINCAAPGDSAEVGDVLFDDIWFGPLGTFYQAKFPIPANNETTVQPTLETLSWQNPDPNNPADMIESDVFLCEGPDPNDLALIAENITDEFVEVSVLPETQYFWRVDCTDPHGDPNTAGPVTTEGEVWTFTTINDNPPVVDAGANQYIWLDMDDGDGDPAQVTFTLTGQVTDDAASPLTIAWSLDEELTQWDSANTIVDIDTPDNPVTTVTIDNTGYFVFQLAAEDTFSSDTDSVVVIVYDSACEAAYGDPDDMQTTYPDGHGDIDGDCDTDLEDFALLAGSWMDCMSDKLGCTP